MNASLKNKVIVVSFIFLWLPFLLLTDLFPFLRFGMFAEPLQQNTSQEFFVLYTQQNGRLQKYDTNLWGLDETVFNYLTRQYHYQGRLKELGEVLVKAHQEMYPQSQEKWYLYREILHKGQYHQEILITYEAK